MERNLDNHIYIGVGKEDFENFDPLFTASLKWWIPIIQG